MTCILPRLVAAVVALVAIASPAVAGEHAADRDNLAPHPPLVQVHYRPSDGPGSWAWTPQGGGTGYHPDGWVVYAETPSSDARTLRALTVGDRVSFWDQVPGAYRIVDPPSLWPGLGECSVMIDVTIHRDDGTTVDRVLFGKCV